MIKLLLAALLLSTTASGGEADLLENIERKINFSLDEKYQLLSEKQDIENQIKDLQTKIKQRKVFLIKRLKAFNRLNSVQWGELLTETKLNDLHRRLKILKNLNEYDLLVFKEYNLSLRQLAQARKNLADTEIQMQNNIKLYKRQQDDFHKLEELRISSLVQNKTDSLLLKRGQIPRPLDGKIKQEFGTLRDQFHQYFLVSRGELYSTKPGAEVKAIGPGVVIFSDALNRWRETLIVQHADNYYSVYAGVKNNTKKIGDAIAAGESLGRSAGNEMYFELRHFANPINPKKWYRE